MNKFTLIINSGRSGSSFLCSLLKQNYPNALYVAHEDIPVSVSKPRLNNRAYTPARCAKVLADTELKKYLTKWSDYLCSGHVVETGWTASHLAPVLHDYFGNSFQYVILHRDPISFSFSRANMGNYHRNTFYDDAHEVSPFDPYSVAPQYCSLWPSMNHFEKCMFWWYTVYLEAFEFRSNRPTVASIQVASRDLFTLASLSKLISFIGLDPKLIRTTDAPKNQVAQFMRETFPLKDEWNTYYRHADILSFAKSLGYEFSYQEIEAQSFKYRQTPGFLPSLRHITNYWKVKFLVSQLLRSS